MAEVIRNGKRYNAATGRYLGLVTDEEAVADPVVAEAAGDEAEKSIYHGMTKAQIAKLLAEAEVEIPKKAKHADLVALAEDEIG